MPKKAPTVEMMWITTDSGKRLHVPVGSDVELLKRDKRSKYATDPETLDAIVGLYMQGHSIAKIGRMKGFPPAPAIYRLLQERSDFGVRMANAKKTRALAMENKAIDTAEAAKGTSSEEVAAKRLQVETYKWAAESNDPGSYGKKVLPAGGGPTVFIINTGIQREEKPAIEIPAALEVEKKDG